MNHYFAKTLCICTLLFSIALSGVAQTYNGQHYRTAVRPTKNLIVLLTDGTSIDVLSTARWYKNYLGNKPELAIDPYFCGLVKTYSSNAPIADSAPAMSAYMTGMPSQSGNISIYPQKDAAADLVEVDESMAKQPLATLLEAAKVELGKATGLVVTVEFPHATPAATASHWPSRKDYATLGAQMAHQNLDVMFGGGTTLVTQAMKDYFTKNGTRYVDSDLAAFRGHTNGKIWALFAPMYLPYVLDADTAQIPSLREMTHKAIDLLNKNDKGFFLMVEGSKIDWAAHANDAAACISEYLAFDDAVAEAMEFAKRDGNTTVVVLSDHGNSGFTLGEYKLPHYSTTPLSTLMRPLAQIKASVYGIAARLAAVHPAEYRSIMRSFAGIELAPADSARIAHALGKTPENYMQVANGETLVGELAKLLNEYNYIGFTTGGHTGEDVLLAAYHPQGNLPMGLNTNIDINHYLADACGLTTPLPQLTSELFAKHTDLFPAEYCRLTQNADGTPTLTVRRKKMTMTIAANSSEAVLNGKVMPLGSVAVCIDGTFYLPRKIKNWLYEKQL